MATDGIVLLAKKIGLTSFTSLTDVKKALGTTKVGHTGTLDSFAQGLLVVCTGRLTKLSSYITDFDKEYSAVIKFGEETDTLEYTGNVVKTDPLPTQEQLVQSLEHFTGTYDQIPPVFSSIHVDGKRASELVRKGKEAQVPSRKVTVHKALLKEVQKTDDGKILYALIDFSVSKGTYIRSLARDIAQHCGSAAHLVGLYRTRVGTFNIEDAAGYDDVKDFTIQKAVQNMEEQLASMKENSLTYQKYSFDEERKKLQAQILTTIKPFDEKTSQLCGFTNLFLVSDQAKMDYYNGKPLRSALFGINLHDLPCNTLCAVFTKEKIFTGLFEKTDQGRLHHLFVIC
ncbi:MAG: tRNA pseudouridine(55) synthase TruB [Treponema sp.]|nr:tRNA pseudouridine(55) synthase TruB [Treponema sp.]